VDDVDAFIAWLKSNAVEIEMEPATIEIPIDPPLPPQHLAALTRTDGHSAKMRIAFFRGPSAERFEVVQDNLAC